MAIRLPCASLAKPGPGPVKPSQPGKTKSAESRAGSNQVKPDAQLTRMKIQTRKFNALKKTAGTYWL
jgi:hypothetical protein